MFNLGNFLGGLYHGATQAIGGFFHPQAPTPRPQAAPPPNLQPHQQYNLGQFLQQHLGPAVPMIERAIVPPVYQPVIKSIGGVPLALQNANKAVTNAALNVPNMRLNGLEQAYNAIHPGQQSAPITLGGVSHHIPILSQAESFAHQQNAQGNPVVKGTQQLIQQAGATGAHYAPYAAPELKVLKLGEGANLAARIGAKAVNNFVPGAATSAIADVATGNRNLKSIAGNAALAGAGNAALSLGADAGKVAIKNLGKFNDALGQSGKLDFQGSFSNPSDLNNHLDLIDQKLQALPNEMNMRREQINSLQAGAGEKTKMLQEMQSSINDQGRNLQLEKAQALDALQKAGGQRNTAPPNIPSGLPPTPPAAPKPSLLQKLASPFRAESGYIAPGESLNPKDQTKADAVAGAKNLATSKATGAVGPQIQQNKFTKNVQNSPEVSSEVQKAVSGQHVVRSTKGLAQSAENNLTSKGLGNATADVHASLAVPDGQITDNTVANAISVAKANDALGTQAGHDNATAIYDALSNHLVRSGQTAQAASLLLHRTPEGMKFTALKVLKKAGVNIDQGLKDEIQKHVEALKAAPDGSQAHYEAAQALAETVNNKIPSSKGSALFRLWRAGLLPGPQTITKVGLSHVVQNAMESASSVPASGLDAIVSGVRQMMGKDGFRSTSATLRGQGAFIKGTKAGVKLLTTGKDTINTGGIEGLNTAIGRGQPHFNGPFKFLNTYMDKIEAIHAAIPKIFYMAAYTNDLNKQAIAAAKNQGLKGAERSAFIKDFVAHPSEQAHAEAQHAGQMATFQQHTKMGEIASKFTQTPGAKVLSPFSHIASAILTDAANYSPVGVPKTIIEAIKGSKGGWTPQVQKHFVEGLGRSITGTAALGTGYALYKAGLMTLDYPKDPKQVALWKANGKQPNSILIGGKWRQLASLGPEAITLGMGGYAAAANQIGGKGNAALAALAGAVKTLSGESFLSGVTGAAGAINNPEMSAASFLKNQASSIIPTAVGTVAKAFDPQERQTNSITDAIASKIPGLREGLLPQQNGFGQNIPRQGSVLENLIDPTRPQQAVSTPLVNELNRLDSTGNTVMPVPVKNIGSGKNAVKLTPQQTAARNTSVGPQIQQAYQTVMQSPGYAALSDANKAKALTNAASDVNSVGNVRTLATINPQAAQKAYNGLTSNQKAMLAGQPSVTDYTGLDANGKALASGKVSPAQAYQTKLATFNQQVKAGLLSPTQIFTQQQSLGKEAITSQYSQNVLDFYNMSKANENAFVAANPQLGTQLYDQAQKLDQQLNGSKFTSTLKFKNGLSTKTTALKTAKPKKLPSMFTRLSAPKRVKVTKIATGRVKGRSLKIAKIPVVKARSSSGKSIKLVA